MAASQVLIVDDEPTIRAVISRAFGAAGFVVRMAENGENALRAAKASPPDIVLLDLLLPDISGDEVCRRLRQDSALRAVPVLILTGCDTEGLLVKCLDGGADDFVQKPFDLKELIARVNALLRRVPPKTPPIIHTPDGHLTIDVAQRLVTAGKRRLRHFAPKEFDMLVHLVQESPKVVDKNALALKGWGIPESKLNPRTLDVHIRRIRQKLGDGTGRCLKTVPAVGYQWVEER